MVSRIYPEVPQVAVGAVVFQRGKVLLVLRGLPPSQGLWAIPGGRVEIGESLQAAAQREVLEETGVKVKAGEVVYTFDVIERDACNRVKYHYIIIDVLAELLEPDHVLHAADDAVDAAWFTLAEINQPDLNISTTTRKLLQQLMPELAA